jgi:hypothetical protein
MQSNQIVESLELSAEAVRYTVAEQSSGLLHFTEQIRRTLSEVVAHD